MHYNPATEKRYDMSVAARIICASGNTPIMANGTLVDRGETQVTVQCDQSAAAITPGAKVVLTFDEGSERWTGVVDDIRSADGGVQIRVVTPNAHAADKRDYPRLHAGLPIQYRISSESEAQQWVDGSTIDEGWQTPDPYMNFSVSGLRFEVHEDVQADQLLLVELRIGEGAESWRTTAKVIRVFEGDDQRSPTAAVSFIHLPEEALSALSELTLQIQDSLL